MLGAIRMSEKKLKFEIIRVNKTEFDKSKQAIDLDLVNVDQIVLFDKLKRSEWIYTLNTLKTVAKICIS